MHTIETERLVLRPFKEDDLDAYHAVLANTKVSEWLGKPEGFSRAEVESMLKRIEKNWNDGGCVWAVVPKNLGKLIGHCGLFFRPQHDGFELLYSIDHPHWGNGYITEAAKASLDYGFNTLKLEKIITFTQPHNLASRRVMEKNGFEYTKDIVHADLPHVFYEKWAHQHKN